MKIANFAYFGVVAILDFDMSKTKTFLHDTYRPSQTYYSFISEKICCLTVIIGSLVCLNTSLAAILKSAILDPRAPAEEKTPSGLLIPKVS